VSVVIFLVFSKLVQVCHWLVDFKREGKVVVCVCKYVLLIQPRDHRTHKPRSKPLLVQTRADEVCQRPWARAPFLAQPVHVDTVAERVGDGANVGREAREAEERRRRVLEDLGKVVREGEGLEA